MLVFYSLSELILLLLCTRHVGLDVLHKITVKKLCWHLDQLCSQLLCWLWTSHGEFQRCCKYQVSSSLVAKLHSEHDPLIFFFFLCYVLPSVVAVLSQSFHLYNMIVVLSLGLRHKLKCVCVLSPWNHDDEPPEDLNLRHTRPVVYLAWCIDSSSSAAT